MIKVILDNIYSIVEAILLASFVGYITYRNNRKNRFAQASIVFTNKILSLFEGLYPIPTNWPQDIDRHLRGIFPKLQSTVSEFREALHWYRRSMFDKAWFIYRLGKDGREIDQQYYWQWVVSGLRSSGKSVNRRPDTAYLSLNSAL